MRKVTYKIKYSKKSNRYFVYDKHSAGHPWARILMENKVLHLLKSEEVVHHINFDSTDDKIENLMITNRSEHRKLHSKQSKK